MKFIIGLGNPGIEYNKTKHNIGFNVVKELAKKTKIKIGEDGYGSLIGRGRILGEEVSLILPQTFMNLSGKAVEELFRQEAKEVEDLLVICDDINLELGKIRMKKRGSSGGQKGLESIIRALGRDDFARLRVGIATEAHKGDITGYVLSPFRRKELRNVTHAVSLAKDAVLSWVKDGVDIAMTRFNKKRAGTS